MRRKKRYTRAAAAGAVTAMAAAALFVGPGAAMADGCSYDSGGNPYCWVDVDTGGGDWYPLPVDDDPGGYESGGDHGGGDDGGDDPDPTLPVSDVGANRRRGVAAQENAHHQMRDDRCFSSVTGNRPTSQNRLAFADLAARFSIEGRSGNSADGTGLDVVAGPNNTYVVLFFDDYGDLDQAQRDVAWLILYAIAYGVPSTPQAIRTICIGH